MASVLQAVDIGLFGAGVVGGLGLLVWLLRGRRWRNPLADIPRADHGPSPLAALGVVAAFFVVRLVVAQAVLPRSASPEIPPPGSTAWRHVQTADMLAQVVLSVLMMAVLSRAWSVRGRESLPVGTGELVEMTRVCSPESAASVQLAPVAPPQHGARLRGLGWALLASLVILPIAALQLKMGVIVWQWLHPGETPPIHPVLQAIEAGTWTAGAALQLAVTAIIVAPVAEELLFRGVVLGAVTAVTSLRWPAIFVSAVFFGLVHGQPQDILPLVTLGVLLGFVRVRTAALWPCVLAHALFNARTIGYALAAPELLREM